MKIIKNLIILFLLFINNDVSFANTHSFEKWLENFKILALKNNISESTFNMAMSDVVFLPKVIKYDRFQPEFYEDTKTYVSKRSSELKVKKGKDLYKSNKDFINLIDEKFSVEKSLLLALMGIETNFGTYVGKMDILSSLATLSFDKRRSEFFTKELITILQLVESEKIKLIVLDCELSPSQERNLEKLLCARVLDRTGLILDIFAARAQSDVGKLQVELAQLSFLSTRLVRGWSHLERQKGGIGLRGPGETQLETDRRLIGNRIKQLKKRLNKQHNQKNLNRYSRKKK